MKPNKRSKDPVEQKLARWIRELRPKDQFYHEIQKLHPSWFKRRVPDGHWTKENCIEAARRYKVYKVWSRTSGAMYARKHGWVKECIAHMKTPPEKRTKWTFERAIALARTCKVRTEFIKKSSAASALLKKSPEGRAWLEKHLPRRRAPRRFEDVLAKAEKYKDRRELRETDRGSYDFLAAWARSHPEFKAQWYKRWKPASASKKWSAVEISKLKRASANGISDGVIADSLGRSLGSVTGTRFRLGIKSG